MSFGITRVIDKVYTELLLHRELVSMHHWSVLKTLDLIQLRQDRLQGMIEDIKPANVVMSKTLARSIVSQLTDPLVIPQAVADMFADTAKHGNVLTTHTVGYSTNSPYMKYEITVKGRLRMTLCDLNGQRVWTGELRGPGA